MYQNRNILNTGDNQCFTKPCFRFGNSAFRRAAADFRNISVLTVFFVVKKVRHISRKMPSLQTQNI